MRLEQLQFKRYPPELRIMYNKHDGEQIEESHYLRSGDLDKLIRRNKILQSLNIENLRECIESVFAQLTQQKLIETQSFKAHSMQVNSIHIAQSTGRIASLGQDDTITFLGEGDPIENITRPFCGSFHSDFLAVGQLSGTIKVFSDRRRIVFEQQTHNQSPCLCINLHQNLLTYGMESGRGYVLDVLREEPTRRLKPHKAEMVSIVWRNRDEILSGGFDGVVHLSDLRDESYSGRSTSTMSATTTPAFIQLKQPILSLQVGKYQGELMIHTTQSVKIFDIRAPLRPVTEIEHQYDITCANLAWDGKVAFCSNKSIQFINSGSRKPIQLEKEAQFIQFTNSGKCQRVIAAVGNDLHVHDLAYNKSQKILGNSFITSLSCEYSGCGCVVGRRDGTVQKYKFE